MDAYRSQLLSFYEQFEKTSISEARLHLLKKSKKPDGIVITGMGGSGLPGTIFSTLSGMWKFPVPVTVWKDYGVPFVPYRNPFFIIISFSGTTEETLSGIKILLKKKPRPLIAVITSNGPLKILAERFHLPLLSFKARHLTPRTGIGYTYSCLIKLLQIYFSFPEVHPLHGGISVIERKAKIIAQKLKNKIPLIYTNNADSHLGYIWKIVLNETAKQPAFTNVIPEMNHNELNGFEHTISRALLPLFMVSNTLTARMKKRLRATITILKKQRIRTLTVSLSGNSPERELWNTVLLAHFTAFYLAQLNHVSPTNTRLINTLKKMMVR